LSRLAFEESVNNNTFVFVAHIDGIVEAGPVYDSPNCTPWHRICDGRMGCVQSEFPFGFNQ